MGFNSGFKGLSISHKSATDSGRPAPMALSSNNG